MGNGGMVGKGGLGAYSNYILEPAPNAELTLSPTLNLLMASPIGLLG